MQQHVMSYEVGGVLEDSEWQAPANCFNADNAAAGDRAGSEVDVMMNSLIRFAGAPSQLHHFDQ
jgi:hypothetical protein